MPSQAPLPGDAGAPAERGRVTAALAAGATASTLALTAWGGEPLLTTAVAAVVGAAVALGWGRMLDLPAPRGTVAVLLVVVALAVAAALTSRLDDRAFGVSVWWALPVAGGVWASLAHQVWRGDGRPRVVDVLTAEVFAVLVVVAGFLWGWSGPATVAVAALGVLVTAVGDALLPTRRWWAWAGGAAVATAAALLLGGWQHLSGAGRVLLVGAALVAPAVSQATRLVLLRLPAVASGASGGVVAGLVSVALTGIVAGLSAMLGPVLA
ncbi:hypothetical protein ACFFHC_00670 [Kytococcus schroeteri]|uniref:hypothetical protein n=1 Tax=Kytococcus schroeteri TaxID=138300 RepID=UPI0035EB57A9